MTRAIYALADAMSRPLAFALLTLAALLASAWVIATADPLDPGTVINLAISVVTMVIGQAVLVSGRRDGLAFHLKLDRIVEALPTSNDPIGAESRSEEEIASALAETERRAANNGD